MSSLIVVGLYDEYFTQGFDAGVSAPALVTAVVAANGTDLVLGFNQPIFFGAGGNAGFVTSPSGGAATLVYSSGVGTNSLIYTVSRSIGDDETLSISYTQPGDGLEDATAVDLDSFVGFIVTNNSSQDTIPPLVTTITVSETLVTFNFNEPVVFGVGGNTGFTLDMSGGPATLVYASGEGSSALVYTASRSIDTMETGTADYVQPTNGVEDIAGNDLLSFAGQNVVAGALLGHNDPALLHKSPALMHEDRTLQHNRVAIAHNA